MFWKECSANQFHLESSHVISDGGEKADPDTNGADEMMTQHMAGGSVMKMNRIS